MPLPSIFFLLKYLSGTMCALSNLLTLIQMPVHRSLSTVLLFKFVLSSVCLQLLWVHVVGPLLAHSWGPTSEREPGSISITPGSQGPHTPVHLSVLCAVNIYSKAVTAGRIRETSNAAKTLKKSSFSFRLDRCD